MAFSCANLSSLADFSALSFSSASFLLIASSLASFSAFACALASKLAFSTANFSALDTSSYVSLPSKANLAFSSSFF